LAYSFVANRKCCDSEKCEAVKYGYKYDGKTIQPNFRETAGHRTAHHPRFYFKDANLLNGYPLNVYKLNTTNSPQNPEKSASAPLIGHFFADL
jgi:hypothetical protein